MDVGDTRSLSCDMLKYPEDSRLWEGLKSRGKRIFWVLKWSKVTGGWVCPLCSFMERGGKKVWGDSRIPEGRRVFVNWGRMPSVAKRMVGITSLCGTLRFCACYLELLLLTPECLLQHGGSLKAQIVLMLIPFLHWF